MLECTRPRQSINSKPDTKQLLNVDDGGHATVVDMDNGNDRYEFEGQWYLELNGSQINPHSTILRHFNSSVQDNGNFLVWFHIPRENKFFGHLSCICYNCTADNASNITSELTFVYVPTVMDSLGNATYFILTFIFCTLFLVAVLALISSCICMIRRTQLVGRKSCQAHSLVGRKSSSKRMLPSKGILTSYQSPLLFTSSGYAVPSCSHTNRTSFCAQNSAERNITQDSVSETSITENALAEDNPPVAVCDSTGFPCFPYKDKLSATLLNSVAEGKLPHTTAAVEVEIEWDLSSQVDTDHSAVAAYEVTTASNCEIDVERGCSNLHKHCKQPVSPISETTTQDVIYPTIKPLSGFADDRDISVKFIDPIDTVVFDCKGGRYANENHQFYLEIPEGAIPKGRTVTIEVGVSLQSSLVQLLPSGVIPVSPLVRLCVVGEEKFRFLTPVKVTMPHFLDIKDEESVKKMDLQFMKAGHSLYCFHQSDGVATFKPHVNMATLMTEHFCTFCIAANVDASKDIAYRLVKVIPHNRLKNQWRANFCVTYYLRTCLQVKRSLLLVIAHAHHIFYCRP